MREDELHVPPGHFYSPIPSNEDFIFAIENSGHLNLDGIDLREAEQLCIAENWREGYPDVVQWFHHQTDKYSPDNTWFFGSDALTLSLMLINQPAQKIIEVGSGFSTALIEDLNSHWFNNGLNVLSIDPNIERVQSLNLTTEVLQSMVQHVEYGVFANLQAGDVLLIDSSHVLKAGSDVHYLYNHVLPHLAAGVRIHIHDIFFPFEYPSSWLAEKIAFNEAYALELLLRNSTKFKILYWNDFLETTQSEWFLQNMPELLSNKYQTGGIWLQVL